MFEQIKEFIKENPGLVAGSAAVGLLLALNFSGDVADVDSASRKPASEIVRGRKRQKEPEFKSLADKVKKRFTDIFKSNKPKKKVKKKPENTAAAGSSSSSAKFGFGDSSSKKSSLDFNTPENNQTDDFEMDNPEEVVEEEIVEETTEEVAETTDTTGTTDGGAGGGGGGFPPTGGGGYIPIVPTCSSAVPGAGIYNENPYVALECEDHETIYYCLTKSTTCDPTDSPTEYNGQILVSTMEDGEQDDGVFNLSFYAVSSTGDESSIVGPISYTVDGSAIPISYAQTDHRKQVQTNEIHTVIGLTSSSFGLSDHMLFTLNLQGDDPNLGPYSCADVIDVHGYTSANDSIRSPAGADETDVSGWDPLDIYDVPLMVSNNLYYGDNWLVHFMQYTDPAATKKYGCINNKVKLWDFHVEQMQYNDSYIGTAGDGSKLTGGVKVWGHFTPGFDSGPGVGASGTNTLETDITNIVH